MSEQTRLHSSSFFDYKKGELQQKSKEELTQLKESLEAATPRSEGAKKKKETSLRYIEDILNDLSLSGELGTVVEDKSPKSTSSLPPPSKAAKAPAPSKPPQRSDDSDSFLTEISEHMAKITIGLAQIGEDVTQGKKGLDLSGWSSRLADQQKDLEKDWKEVIGENRWVLRWVTPTTRLTTRVSGSALKSWSENNGAYVCESVGECTESFSSGVKTVSDGVKEKVKEIRERFGPLPEADGEMKDPSSSLPDSQEDGDQKQE
jgi:hypothetical protein